MSETRSSPQITPSNLERKYAMELTAEIIQICNNHPEPLVRDSLIFQLMLRVTKTAAGYMVGFTDGVSIERERCAKIAESKRIEIDDKAHSVALEEFTADAAYNQACEDIAAKIREGKS